MRPGFWFAAPILIALAMPSVLAAQRDGYITTSDSGRLYYKIAGHGPDTLIAIHGGPGLDLESIAGDFTAGLGNRHTIIFYDQRGGGKSELPDDTTRLVAARQIQDLDEVRAHFGLRRVALIAHSYGPLLAASYALSRPDAVRAMVFFGPVPPRRGDFWIRFARNLDARLDDTQRARMTVEARTMVDPSSPDSAARAACRAYWAIAMRPRLADPDRTMTLIKSDLCVTDVAGLRYGNRIANRVIMISYGDWDLRPGLATLRVPLLVVHGEAETIPMDLVEEWVSSMPPGRATLVTVPNAAHFAYAERPELVWPAVERFLSTAGSSSR